MQRLCYAGALGIGLLFLIGVHGYYPARDAYYEATSVTSERSLPSPGSRWRVNHSFWVAADEAEVELTFPPDVLDFEATEKLAEEKRLFLLIPGDEIEVLKVCASENGGPSLVGVRVESDDFVTAGLRFNSLYTVELAPRNDSTSVTASARQMKPHDPE